MVWRFQEKRRASDHQVLRLKRWEPSLPPPWFQMVVTSLDGFQVQPVTALSPHQVQKLLREAEGDDPEWCRGICLSMSRNGMEPLVRSAARQGFRNMSCVHLGMLISYAGVPYDGTKPSKEAEMVELLCRWQFPNSTDEEIQQMMARRKPQPARQHLLTEENAEAVEGLMHQDEAMEVKKTTKVAAKRAKATSAFAGVGDDAPLAALATSSSSSGSGAGRRRVVPARAYTAEEARTFLPSAPGAWLGIHTKVAWQVKYPPRKTRPRSHTETWNINDVDASYSACMVKCLERAWMAHQEVTGERCPWDFSELRRAPDLAEG